MFAKTALEANRVFEVSDPLFKSDFTKQLINDVCELTKDLFKQREVDKCVNQMHYKMLNEGLISTMQFFQRIVYQAVFDLRESLQTPEEYFRKNIFEDLDDYIFYMFRLYQATQARMNLGLVNTINRQITNLAFYSTAQILLFLSVLGYWLYWRETEKD